MEGQPGSPSLAPATPAGNLADDRATLLKSSSIAASAAAGGALDVSVADPADSDGAPQQGQLQRRLGALDLTALGLGGIIGAGVFALSGVGAQAAGPAVVLSFLLAGVACLFSALCYSELGAAIPSAGSAYAFVTAALGIGPGFAVGWNLALEYCIGASTVAVGFSGYLNSLLKEIGVGLPAAIAKSPVAYHIKTGEWGSTGSVFNLPAIAIVAAATWINVRGVEASAKLNTVIVAIKATVLLLFVFVGFGYTTSDNWHPFVPTNTGEYGTFGFSGVLRGAAVVFFAFIGFDSISCVAQEAKNPQRTIPIATISSLTIAVGLYMCVSAVMTGLVPFPALDTADPLAVAVDGAGISWLRPIVKLGAVIGLSSVTIVLIMGQSRILFAMAAGGFLPPVFRAVHPRYHTPHKSIILTGAVAALIAGLFPIDVLGEMVSIGTLWAFAFVCAGVIVLRRRQPMLPRFFKVPFYPWTPLLGVASAIGLMVSLPGATWIRLVVWLALGGGLYWWYVIRPGTRRGWRAHFETPPLAPVASGAGGNSDSVSAALMTSFDAAASGGGPDVTPLVAGEGAGAGGDSAPEVESRGAAVTGVSGGSGGAA